jgi:hypothetical protein
MTRLLAGSTSAVRGKGDTLASMRTRAASALVLLALVLGQACSVDADAGSGAAAGSGGADLGATSTAASSSTSTSTSTSSSSSSSGQVTKDSPLKSLVGYPDPSLPWRGAVFILPSGQVGSWSLDGAPLPSPTPDYPSLLLDTRIFPDGEHLLSLEALKNGKVSTFSGKVTFANGPAAEPSLQGTFVDVAAALELPSAGGYAGKNHAGAIAGDLDGDGDLDLVVWLPFINQVRVYVQTAPSVFTLSETTVSFFVASAALGDLDGDGLPELVLGGDGLRIFKYGPAGLIDVSAQTGISLPPGITRDYQGITMVDIDDDGLLDLMVAQLNCDGDSGANLVLRNEGALHFADVAPELGLVLAEARTFAFAADRVGTDGALHVWPYHDFCKGGPMPKHYRFVQGPDLPVLLDAKEPKHNVGPMGSAVLDADGDGLLDELVTGCFNNPVWNAPDFSATISPYIGVDAFPDSDGRFVTAWAMATLDADLDGRPDAYVTHHPSDPKGNIDGAADALFWQQGPGHFRDIAAATGLTGFQPCRSVQVIDLDSDGDSDLLVGCRGGVRILRNDLVDPTPGRTIVLHGTVSTRDGVNAMITSPSGESRLVRGGGNPYAGGVTRESLRAPSGMLTVAWPSGIVQKVDVGAAPVLHVTEPPAASVMPRRVSAAMPAPVQIQVRPAQLGLPDAPVTVTPSAGVFTEPMHKDADGIWRGKLAVPAQIATVVIEVSVGAQKLAVRPKIYVR